MKTLIAFPLADADAGAHEGFVVCEIEEAQPPSGAERVARYDEILYKAKVSFEAAMEGVKPVAEILMRKLKDIASPREVAVEFGIKANAETGAIISSISAEANFKVTLKWVYGDKPSGGGEKPSEKPAPE
jgi:hypothetical protein